MQKLTPYQLKALEYNKHVSVTANAGSGKTFVFAKRFVEVALSDETSLQNIIAITFTDKAAGELNSRIAREVEEKISVEQDKAKLAKLRNIRSRLVSANISTIHSFCIELLKEYSPEAGIDANFVPIDQRTADELLELSIDEAISQITGEGQLFEKYKYLVRTLGSKLFFRKQLTSLFQKRKIINDLKSKLYSGTDDEILNFYGEIFEVEFKNIFGNSIPGIIEAVKLVNDKVLSVKDQNEIALNVKAALDNYSEDMSSLKLYEFLIEILELILTQKGTIRLKGYLDKNGDELAGETGYIEKFYNELKVMNFDLTDEGNRELVVLGRNFLEVFELIENKYSEKKISRGYLDFEDILLFALKLTADENVKARLSQKYKYIMIDEYQDTNDIQYEIFMPVLDNLKQGNLFVVGDEKQSIYMFRNADISIYRKTKDELNSLSDKSLILNLPHSFRMYPAPALFTNTVFGKLFSNPNHLFNEVEHSDLVCARDQYDPGSVEIILTDDFRAESEAENIGRRILTLYRNNSSGEFNLGDVAVLCRKRSNFKELEKAFNKNKIPYVVIGGRGFYQQQVIVDIFNYLSFLLDSNNDTALVGILKSPFFMMSDPNLYDLSLHEGAHYYHKLKQFVKVNKHFTPVVKILEYHIQLTATYEIPKLIRAILNDTGYWAMISGLPDSNQQIKNIEKIINIATGFSTQSFATLYDFINYLKTSIENIQDEGQAVLEENKDAVKLMTIHQSKGLEFSAVFIYRAHEYGKDSKLKAKQIEISREYGILSKVYTGSDYFEDPVIPPIVGLFNFIEEKKQLAELKRLFYVAVTRSIKHLIISGNILKTPRKDSFLGLLSAGLNTDFNEEELLVEDDLGFMENEGEEFKFFTRPLKITIPLLREVSDESNLQIDSQKKELSPGVIEYNSVIDFTSKEIISATKISVFNQCPVKYELTYELGFSDLSQLVKKNINTFDYKFKEDEETKGYGDIKGRIVHALLDKDVNQAELEQKLELFAAKELSSEFLMNKQKEITEDVFDIMNKYYSSNTYKEIKRHKNFLNEYEIYTAENDFYLYGIIDKLIIEEDKIIIVDYKTDSIKREEVVEKADVYFPQLMFYANILRRKFKKHPLFELKLVFLQHPEETVTKKAELEDIEKFNLKVLRIVSDIRNKNYTKNKNHCSNCFYRLGKSRCVKST